MPDENRGNRREGQTMLEMRLLNDDPAGSCSKKMFLERCLLLRQKSNQKVGHGRSLNWLNEFPSAQKVPRTFRRDSSVERPLYSLIKKARRVCDGLFSK